jgi:hypothetical protein
MLLTFCGQMASEDSLEARLTKLLVLMFHLSWFLWCTADLSSLMHWAWDSRHLAQQSSNLVHLDSRLVSPKSTSKMHRFALEMLKNYWRPGFRPGPPWHSPVLVRYSGGPLFRGLPQSRSERVFHEMQYAMQYAINICVHFALLGHGLRPVLPRGSRAQPNI